jgi:hypothetical protein
MSETEYKSLNRLRAANPVQIQADLGHTEAAQATLRRILSEPAVAPERRRRRGWWSRVPGGGLGVGLAAVVIGGGAAFAATDPFGWISSSPDTAKYEVNQAVRVRVPYIDQIACHSGGGHGLICSPRGSGQRYMWAEKIPQAPPASNFTRANLLKAIAGAQASHRLSSAAAARFRADLARVPDSFFVEFRLAARYQTIGTADGRVPPAGVPEWVVCQGNRSTLSCQNLNGAQHVPVGAAIFMAQPERDWHRAPRTAPDYRLPPGIRFTRAEYRLLFDLGRDIGTSSGSARRGVARRAP